MNTYTCIHTIYRKQGKTRRVLWKAEKKKKEEDTALKREGEIHVKRESHQGLKKKKSRAWETKSFAPL